VARRVSITSEVQRTREVIDATTQHRHRGRMTKPLYTTQARVTGGREHGHGRTTDGSLDLRLRPPKELGGDGEGTNPEQLFAIGYAACFEAALLLAAQRLRAHVADVAIDSTVMLVPTGERSLVLRVELAVELPSVGDSEQAAELVRAAHGICPYSNATRGNIDVALSVNGAPLD
jgi:lipoyl-dependent peroxiredoxin